MMTGALLVPLTFVHAQEPGRVIGTMSYGARHETWGRKWYD